MATFRTSQPDSAADTALPHIVLVGLPGCGKTTVGSLLAKRLGRTFLDFDHEIARREGMTIAEIFAQHGEHRFRQLEADLTKELVEFGNMVLAPGGGWMSIEENVAVLRPQSRIVYLRSSPAAALKRMGSKVSGRPLLMRPNPLGELQRIYELRKVAYERADAAVDVDRLDPQRVVDKVVSVLAG